MTKSKPIRYIFSAPFIYGMFLPSLFFHVCLEVYHQICFRLYGIPRVNQSEYFLFDRELLDRLNWFEKVNCIYCSYENNLIRYAMEIAGRTERYWCPLKYHRRLEHAHSQYQKFIDDDHPEKLYQEWEKLQDFSDLEDKE